MVAQGASQFQLAGLSSDEGLQVDLPACMLLDLVEFSINHLHFFSCSNVQSLRWQPDPVFTGPTVQAAPRPLHDFLCNTPRLQKLEIRIKPVLELELDPFFQFLFCGVWEEGVWQDIKSVEVDLPVLSWGESHVFSRIVGRQRDYDKSWKVFTVTKLRDCVTIRAFI